MIVNSYDVDGNFNSKEEAIEWLRGFVFSDCETTEEEIDSFYLDFIEEFEGVKMYYDIRGDYYLFIDSENI